ncbi:unnamed protein product [Anisakis simplex]|uniref:Putative selenium-binding protein (inferred by orthology to a C. elegans protein) n=2 Tax=Anisakis simplex TaxID=6269 RepID=A0A0M3KAT1_ANISI|nr:unnamed protein product [Anisakis simplex]
MGVCQVKIVREKSIIVCCANANAEKPDKIMVIDVDPTRATYGQPFRLTAFFHFNVLSFAELPTIGDELIHMGWSQTAATRDDMSTLNRRYLIAPCINTSRIYIFDYHDERISIHKCISEEVLFQKDLSAPYAIHSLPQRGTPVLISTLGDRHGHARGDFIVLNRKTFDVAHERVESDKKFAKFGGYFAAQPKYGFMISTEWGHPRLFKHGLLLSDLANGGYGNRLNVWRTDGRSLKEVIELDECDGCMTNVVRFLHNKEVNHGFACSAYGSAIFHIHVNSLTGKVCVDKVAEMGQAEVDGWAIERLPAMIADLVISMDDRFMYASAWLHGYVAQYDITDPFRVSLCSKVRSFKSYPNFL